MQKCRTLFPLLLTIFALMPHAIAQATDTGTAHKAAATALFELE